MYEFTGEVVKVCPTKAVGQKQRLKRELWIRELPEGKYPNTVPFVLKGERCKAADSLSEGDEVKIGFVLEGHVWDKPDVSATSATSAPRCFGSNVCLKLEKTASAPAQELPMTGGADEPPEEMPF